MNVRLRGYRRSDAAWATGWAAAVLRSSGVDAECVARLLADPDRQVHVIEQDAQRAGIVAMHAHQDDATAAIIDFVATPAEFARRGLGMRAAALLEASLARRRVHTVYAPAPETHGIAVYFWIRLGYRPLPSSEWPDRCDGMIWMRRDLPLRTTTSPARRRTRLDRSTPAAARARSSLP